MLLEVVGTLTFTGTLSGMYLTPIDGPSWTVQTLVVLYLFFPTMIHYAQRMTDEALIRGMVWCYWGQFVLMLVTFIVGEVIYGDVGINIALFHPVTRFPVFLLGVYGGVLCLRYPTGQLPWPSTLLWGSLPSFCIRKGGQGCNPKAPETTEEWAKYATCRVATFLATLFTMCIVDSILVAKGNSSGTLAFIWLTAYLPFLELEVLVALTRDGATSSSSKFLRHPLCQWLGNVSDSHTF